MAIWSLADARAKAEAALKVGRVGSNELKVLLVNPLPWRRREHVTLHVDVSAADTVDVFEEVSPEMVAAKVRVHIKEEKRALVGNVERIAIKKVENAEHVKCEEDLY